MDENMIPIVQGKREITYGDFHLEPDAKSCMDEYNYYSLRANCNVDEIFGTNVETSENVDWLEILFCVSQDYAACDPYLDLILHTKDGDQDLRYHLSHAEAVILLDLCRIHEAKRLERDFGNHDKAQIIEGCGEWKKPISTTGKKAEESTEFRAAAEPTKPTTGNNGPKTITLEGQTKTDAVINALKKVGFVAAESPVGSWKNGSPVLVETRPEMAAKVFAEAAAYATVGSRYGTVRLVRDPQLKSVLLAVTSENLPGGKDFYLVRPMTDMEFLEILLFDRGNMITLNWEAGSILRKES